MVQKFLIAVIAGLVIIGAVIAFQIDQTTWKKSSTEEYYEKMGTQSVSHVVYPDNPQILYGLQINKDKYVLGENIFVIIRDVPMQLRDKIIFETPGGIEYHTIEVDGNKYTSGKEYFRPQLLLSKQLCEKDMLIGQWKAFFKSNPGEFISFEITNEILPRNESYYEGCLPTDQEFVPDPTRMAP